MTGFVWKLALPFRNARAAKMTTIHEIITLPCESREAQLSAMDRSIARLNIEYFRKLLAYEQDHTKRQWPLRLLAEEEAKLAALDGPPKGKHD